MDGHFGREEGIVWDPARGLVGVVDTASIDPFVRVLVGGIELTCRKERHVAVVEPVEWDVNVTSTVEVGYGVLCIWRLSCQLRSTIVELAGSAVGDALSTAARLTGNDG